MKKLDDSESVDGIVIMVGFKDFAIHFDAITTGGPRGKIHPD